MPKTKAELAEIVIEHILEINTGQCSITEASILSEEDVALQEILTGMLFLHQDLMFRTRKREQAEEEQRTLEKQLLQSQKMEALGTLAGGIAHDFNGILTTILGNLTLLRGELPADGEGIQHLDHMTKTAERAVHLVKQILTFSRAESAVLEPINISPQVRDALDMLRSSLPAKVEIEEDVQNNCSNVMANATQIHQVIVNLCTNAFHAMEEKGGVLAVSLRQLERCPLPSYLGSGPCLLLTVKDAGCGMPPEVKSRMFDPFFTTKEAGKGTGLGLAVVHGIVSSHRGEIVVESEVGRGTTCKIYLPVAD